MLRRSRPTRLLLATAFAALLVPSLASCGDDSDQASDPASSAAAGGTAGQIDGVSFTGDVGDSLTAEWTGTVEAPDKLQVTTLVEGDGDEVAEGDLVGAYLYVGDATTKTDAYSDYDNGAAESIPNDERAGDLFPQIMTGATYGSRVAAVTTADELFGGSAEGNSLGIGVDDVVVVVIDLVEKKETSPTPTDDQAHDTTQDTQPAIVEDGGDPSGLDFSGIDEPALDTPVQRLTLKEGTGRPLKASDTVTVNYLGAVYDADAPFDESYSRGEPLTSPLSGLIQGWTIGLTGVKVGSRVLLQIPPAYGYGEQGSGTSIPANATLWFVIDVLKAE